MGKFGAFRILVYRDLQIRYAGTWLGYLWTLLDPLAMSAIYWFVFSYIIGAKSIGEQPYILFLLTGILSWTWFNGAVTDSARSLVVESKMVRSISIPRYLWIIKSIGAKGTEFIFALPILVVVAIIFNAQPSIQLLYIPFAVLIQFLLLSGIGLILAPLTVLARDTSNILRILLRMMFYLTPIIYGISDIPERFQVLSYFNPMTGIISMYRIGFWNDTNLITPVIFSTVISILIFIIGIIFFKKVERSVLKEI
ncbi:MAG: ABC transporter permease [Candidatus Nanopelagicales bacterium]|nr:ABC transporter permease [Candidatus Nanopelagicales bacterium]